MRRSKSCAWRKQINLRWPRKKPWKNGKGGSNRTSVHGRKEQLEVLSTALHVPLRTTGADRLPPRPRERPARSATTTPSSRHSIWLFSSPHPWLQLGSSCSTPIRTSCSHAAPCLTTPLPTSVFLLVSLRVLRTTEVVLRRTGTTFTLQMTVLNHPASRYHTFLATRGILHNRQVFFAGAPAHFLRTSHFYGLGLSYVRSTTKNIVHLAGRAATEPTRACLPHRPPWTSQQNTDLASCALSALTYTWERRHPSTPACFTTARLVPPAKSHFGAMKHWSSVASCWWSNPSSKRQ